MQTSEQIRVEAPARLHVGFMDLHGGLGRVFGSLGIALEGLSTCLTITKASAPLVSGACAERAQNYAAQLCKALDIKAGFDMRIESIVPQHAGLGSGTQMAMAVGSALNSLYSLGLSPLDIARILSRGTRSGIGIGAFQHGGFMIDGGRRTQGGIPRITSRIDFPENWRILLILDQQHQGLHGSDEKTVFENLPQFPEEKAAMLCRVVVMSILPALVEADLAAFGAGISVIQRAIGDYFATAQSGRYSSVAVADILAELEQRHISAIGQSSWGPTGFAVVEDQVQANSLKDELQSRYPDNSGLQFRVVRARNQGGVITRVNTTARDAVHS